MHRCLSRANEWQSAILNSRYAQLQVQVEVQHVFKVRYVMSAWAQYYEYKSWVHIYIRENCRVCMDIKKKVCGKKYISYRTYVTLGKAREIEGVITSTGTGDFGRYEGRWKLKVYGTVRFGKLQMIRSGKSNSKFLSVPLWLSERKAITNKDKINFGYLKVVNS